MSGRRYGRQRQLIEVHLPRITCLTIEAQFCVEFAGPRLLSTLRTSCAVTPAFCGARLSCFNERLQIGCTGDNCAYVQIMVPEPVDSRVDSRCDGIVHGQMTQRTSEADFCERVVVEGAHDTQYGVLLE